MARRNDARPAWWDWELVLSPHVIRRMSKRRFSEIDLRSMLEEAFVIGPSRIEGRWLLRVSFERRLWKVVVEPDEFERRLVVVTAYPVESA